MTLKSLVSCGGLAVLLSVAPASADWLVTRAGARVETKGPWQVKGNQIVFTQPNGRLSSLRASDVDLDASAKATSEAAQAPVEKAPEAAPAKKKSVLVLTDKDVGHVDASSDTPPPPTESEAAAADKPAAAGAVVVDVWERQKMADNNGVEIFGSIKNSGKDTATDISLVVKIYDIGGAMVASVDATLSATVLAPDGTTNFRATFPGVLDFTSARFQVTNRNLVTKKSDAPKPANS